MQWNPKCQKSFPLTNRERNLNKSQIDIFNIQILKMVATNLDIEQTHHS